MELDDPARYVPRWAVWSFAIGVLLFVGSVVAAFIAPKDWFVIVAVIGLLAIHTGLRAAKRAIDERQR